MSQVNIELPTEPAPVQKVPVSHKNIVVLLLVAFVLIVLSVSATYFLLQSQVPPQIPPDLPPDTTTNNESNLLYPTVSDGTYETANWKTYTGDYFSFKYPSDWIVREIDFNNTVRLSNKNNTLNISISDFPFPYGFENPDTKLSSRNLVVKVDKREYYVNEIEVNKETIFVDFMTESKKGQYILFGTGYPGGFGAKTSLTDYYNSKNTVLQILSSLQYLN